MLQAACFPSGETATEAVRGAQEYLDAGVPVGRHLADEFLVPMALAGGGAFRTLPLSEHTRTNIEVMKRFLRVDVVSEQSDGNTMLVRVEAR